MNVRYLQSLNREISKGAVCLPVSEEVIADNSEKTFTALQQKHPPPHLDTVICSLPKDLKSDGELSESAVLYAICSFPSLSADGPDGLRPQHIRDMTGHTAGESSYFLL